MCVNNCHAWEDDYEDEGEEDFWPWGDDTVEFPIINLDDDEYYDDEDEDDFSDGFQIISPR